MTRRATSSSSAGPRRRGVRAARGGRARAWTAEYYAAGVGETIPAVLPPKTRGARADAHKTVRIASITPRDRRYSNRSSCDVAVAEQRGRTSVTQNSAKRSTCSPARRGHRRLRRSRGEGSQRICSRAWSGMALSAFGSERRGPRSVRGQTPGVRSPLKPPAPWSDPFEPGLPRDADRRAGAAFDRLARSPTRAPSASRCCTASPAAARPKSTCASPPPCARRPPVLMLVPEIALTPAVARALPPRVRRSRGHPAQRPVRRRTARSVAAHPPRRHRRRRRHAVGGVRAARARRADHRRRGARRLVQAGGESPLQRPRRRHRARAARGRARRARLGDAVDGELPQRDGGQVRARRPRAPRARSAAGGGDRSSTCARSTRPPDRT